MKKERTTHIVHEEEGRERAGRIITSEREAFEPRTVTEAKCCLIGLYGKRL